MKQIKRIRCVLATLVLSALIGIFGVTAFAAAPVTLTKDAVIVIPEDASVLEKTAAERLRERLETLFSLTLEITTAHDGRFEISIGRTDNIREDLSAKADGSYIIRAYPGGIALCGAGGRGNISAVYRFLEEYGDCLLLSPNAQVQTDKASIQIPADADISYEPTFEFTETDWLTPKKAEYALFYGLTGGPNSEVPDAFGGYVDYLPRFAHTLATFFCARDKYFQSHPEYFCLRDGKRLSEQLCLTNENVYEIVKREVFELLESSCNPNAALQVISLSQDDNPGFCQCADCQAVDDENGSHAGTMISFVNRIAREVAAAGYDNVAIDTFAYQYTQTAPAKVRPEPNVIVRLCSINCCFSHPLADGCCEANRTFLKDLADWNSICNRLYIWDYTTNFRHTAGPFPNFGVLQANIRCFRQYGVKGVYEEGNYYMDQCDTEFGELRSFVTAKLLQNPDCDFDAVMNRFLRAYYGDAWREIRSYIDKTTQNGAKNHLSIYESMQTTFDFTQSEIAELNETWNRAKALTTGSAHEHVLRSELSWRYWKASVGAAEFAGNGESAAAARRQLMADLRSAGTTRLYEADWDGLDDGFMYVPAAPAAENQNENNGASAEKRGFTAWLSALFATVGRWFRALFGRLFRP